MERLSRCSTRGPRSRAGGFTLIELLVVIAIIGVLVALLLPAVQAAREAARRNGCSSSARQWGLAMANYVDANKWLPYGVRHTPRHSWPPCLWPYIEQEQLYQNYDFTIGFYSTGNEVWLNVQIPNYFCPSDRTGFWLGDSYYRSRGNYVLNWGNGDVDQNPVAGAGTYLNTPFTYNNHHRLREITDGLSKTMYLSEVIQAVDDAYFDWRGDILNDDNGCAMFMVINTPNAGTDYTACQQVYPNDPSPCVNGGGTTNYVSARSRHGGGVTVLMGDGAVIYVTDDVSLSVWQAMSSMAGNEDVDLSSLR